MPLTVTPVAQPSTTATAITTTASAVVTVADTSLLAGALKVTGAGIPIGTLVATITSATQLTLSNAATASASVTLTFTLEPVSLAEAKDQLRVTWTNDDALIARLIPASRKICETIGKVTCINTSFDMVDDGFPFTSGYMARDVRTFYRQFGGGVFPGVANFNAGVITFPRAPVVSVTSVTYLDSNGASQVMASTAYRVITGAPGRLGIAFGGMWPVTLPVVGAVTIRFVAGNGVNASTSPENVKQAILLYLTDLYENRGEVLAGNPVALSTTIQQLLGCENNTGGYA